MADAKHTQDGEWSCDHFTGRAPITIEGGRMRLIKSGDTIVAFLPQWEDVPAEALEAVANARLMTAAPKLLKALTRIAQYIEPTAVDASAMQAIACDAIANITGDAA